MSNFIPDYILFSDASVRTDHEDRSVRYSAYGAIILNTKTNQYIKFGNRLGTNSIVFAEAWGIYKALKTLIPYVGEEDTSVLMVTDSKLNVQILGDYIPNRWDTSDWYHWIKSDGEPVKNQYIYRRIYTILMEHPNLKFRITHINSHQDVSDIVRTVFKLQAQGIIIDTMTADTFIQLNSMVDEIASDETLAMKHETNSFYNLIREDGFEYVR